MNGIWKGTVLGAANVVLIAIGMAAIDGDPAVAMLVMMFGGLPGIVGGVVLGALAQAFEAWPPVGRVGLLALPALGLVYLLAHEFHMTHLALVSSIPTVVAALILERWTRKPAEPPPVPVARAIS